MDDQAFLKLRPDLVSLGFAFYGEGSAIAPDPEKTIIEIIKVFDTELKVAHMMLAWMERFGDLIHVERLMSLSKELKPRERVFLGVIALKQVNAGDLRYRSLLQKIKLLPINTESPWPGEDPYLIEKYGIDAEFESFGIKTSLFYPSENKKLFSRSGIIERNLWLRLRVLLGTNFRADLAFVRLSGLAKNAYAAMQNLKCSKETCYRIWKSLDEAEIENMIAIR